MPSPAAHDGLSLGNFHTWGYPLLLSSLAGLSTTIGGIIAVLSKPSDARLAFLLGLAFGVMSTVSMVELFIHNAMTNNPFMVTASVLLGATLYYILSPLLPKMEEDEQHQHAEDVEEPLLPENSSSLGPTASGAKQGGEVLDLAVGKVSPLGHLSQSRSMLVPGSCLKPSQAPATNRTQTQQAWSQTATAVPQASRTADAAHPSVKLGTSRKNLLRLGLLMAVTMTLHNLPEGLAVGFSAFTKAGPMMAVAIAVHNIPEGVIIAAPIFAATNSRARALLLTTLSGMSEPVGAMLALLLLSPWMNAVGLHYWLGGTGGVMLAVCGLELWPEGRRCGHDQRLLQGIAAGSLLMAWTLYVGV